MHADATTPAPLCFLKALEAAQGHLERHRDRLERRLERRQRERDESEPLMAIRLPADIFQCFAQR
jgi:hypothetical protein